MNYIRKELREIFTDQFIYDVFKFIIDSHFSFSQWVNKDTKRMVINVSNYSVFFSDCLWYCTGKMSTQYWVQHMLDSWLDLDNLKVMRLFQVIRKYKGVITVESYNERMKSHWDLLDSQLV